MADVRLEGRARDLWDGIQPTAQLGRPIDLCWKAPDLRDAGEIAGAAAA